MHYYQHSIGDYRRDTMHLTLLEHGIYRQLIDLYYLNECELNANALRLICARTAEEVQAAESVLNEFFIKTETGYTHKRCDAEIERFHTKSAKAKASADARWGGVNANALPMDSERIADGMLTNNHKPLTNNQLNTLVPNDVVDDCPHEKIIESYHKHLPMLTQVKVWSDKRQKLLKTRWREEPKRQRLEFWDKFFSYVAKSDFLTGRAGQWQADIEWLLNSSNFLKVIEGKYENKAAA